METRSFNLKDGNKIPMIGLGTWQLRGKKCENAVRIALDVGYRMIDSADFYFNHKQVGAAVKDSGLDRSQVFITSKVWYWNLSQKKVIKSGEKNVKDLGLDFIDLYLIHWPNKRVDMGETFSGLKDLKDRGLIRSIGVSNFTIKHVKEALEILPDIVVNQVEYHPSLNQTDLKKFCEDNGIFIEGYSSLSAQSSKSKEKLTEIGQKYGKTAYQVTINWLVKNNIIAIPRSSSPEHIKENFESLDFEISDEDNETINSLNENRRVVKPFIGEFD